MKVSFMTNSHSPSTLRAEVLQFLSVHCQGRSNGLHVKDVVRRLGLLICEASERAVRKAIDELREELGVAIVGKPNTGYFIATSQEELEEGCAFLRSRAMNSLRAEAQMRRISLPALLGQLQVNS
jgi:hypothetical protein